MRKIKFRGRRLETGEWVYGLLILKNKIRVIHNHSFINKADGNNVEYQTYEDFIIDPNTVGQFTGVYDKNKVEIYEGDRCELRYINGLPSVFGKVIWGEIHTHFSLLNDEGGCYSLSMGGSLVDGIYVLTSWKNIEHE